MANQTTDYRIRRNEKFTETPKKNDYEFKFLWWYREAKAPRIVKSLVW